MPKWLQELIEQGARLKDDTLFFPAGIINTTEPITLTKEIKRLVGQSLDVVETSAYALNKNILDLPRVNLVNQNDTTGTT